MTAVMTREDRLDEAHYQAGKAIDAKIHQAARESGQKKMRVSYAVKYTASGKPVDNLDKIAARGKAVFVASRKNWVGGARSNNYRSEVMKNPTWLQVAVCANAQINRVNDLDHIFLERIHKVGKEDGVSVYEFGMGS